METLRQLQTPYADYWTEENKAEYEFLINSTIHSKLVELSQNKTFDVYLDSYGAADTTRMVTTYTISRRENVVIYADLTSQMNDKSFTDDPRRYAILSLRAVPICKNGSCTLPAKDLEIRFITANNFDKLEKYLTWLEETLSAKPFPNI